MQLAIRDCHELSRNTKGVRLDIARVSLAAARPLPSEYLIFFRTGPNVLSLSVAQNEIRDRKSSNHRNSNRDRRVIEIQSYKGGKNRYENAQDGDANQSADKRFPFRHGRIL